MFDSILSYGLPAAFGLIIGGMVIVLIGGELLLRGATILAVVFKIPQVVVGLTVLAWSTSAPEFAISVSAALMGNADISVGNVVGSNICNICVILGSAALLAPVTVSSTLVKREIPFMIAVTVAVFGFALCGIAADSELQKVLYIPLGVCDVALRGCPGLIKPYVGGIFIGVLALYTLWIIHQVRRNNGNNAILAEEIRQQVPVVQEKSKKKVIISIIFLIIGVALLAFGSDAMVAGSVSVAKAFGVSELIIGLTIIAVGTSLPELIVSTMAAFKGKHELAVGNVVGSNIINILGVLGPAVLISGLFGNGLTVSPRALFFDIPMLIIVSCFCLIICFTGRRVTRGEGLFLLLCYAAYIAAACAIELL
jgi:cation:H+ antiporter